jgi:hypothetical protein
MGSVVRGHPALPSDNESASTAATLVPTIGDKRK